jgi:Lysylphosphatidylglycerol synthase TM region
MVDLPSHPARSRRGREADAERDSALEDALALERWEGEGGGQSGAIARRPLRTGSVSSPIPPLRRAGTKLRSAWRRHPTAVTVAGSVVVAVALVVALAGQRAEFATALNAAPVWILVVAAVLQMVWLAVRSETWSLCVGGAGGRVTRRLLYPAASIGYLGNLLNGQFGLAVRIAALRRSAPNDSPRASVLAATEVPIVVVEAALAALMSFTLVGPLGLDWWIPPVGLAITIAAMIGLRRLARDRRRGVWKGLAIMRELSGRNRIIGLVVLAVCLQVARNWFVLNGVGVDASVLDSVALLIGMAVLGVLPIGPSLGAASAVLVFGADTGAAAAAGALLTATAAVGALCFAASALLGSVRRSPAPVALASS